MIIATVRLLFKSSVRDTVCTIHASPTSNIESNLVEIFYIRFVGADLILLTSHWRTCISPYHWYCLCSPSGVQLPTACPTGDWKCETWKCGTIAWLEIFMSRIITTESQEGNVAGREQRKTLGHASIYPVRCDVRWRLTVYNVRRPTRARYDSAYDLCTLADWSDRCTTLP